MNRLDSRLAHEKIESKKPPLFLPLVKGKHSRLECRDVLTPWSVWPYKEQWGEEVHSLESQAKVRAL